MYVSVQWLRGLAAAMVVYFHATLMVQEHIDPTIQAATLGAAGVDLFFVISGFIMATTTGNSQGRRSADVRQFLFRRFVRVMPMYWGATGAKLAIVLAMPHLALHSTITVPYVLSSLMLVPMANNDGHVMPLLVVGWTLSYEAFFYITFALSMGTRLGAVRLTTFVFALFALLGTFLPLATWADPLSLLSPLLLEFLFGMWIAAALKTKLTLSTSVAVLCAFFAMACLGATSMLSPESCYQYRTVLWGVPSALFLLSVVVLEQKRGHIKETFFRLLGDASYSTYLVHCFTLPLVGRVFAKLVSVGVLLPNAVMVLTGIAVSLASGVVIHLYLERPLLERLRGLWPTPSTANMRAAP